MPSSLPGSLMPCRWTRQRPGASRRPALAQAETSPPGGFTPAEDIKSSSGAPNEPVRWGMVCFLLIRQVHAHQPIPTSACRPLPPGWHGERHRAPTGQGLRFPPSYAVPAGISLPPGRAVAKAALLISSSMGLYIMMAWFSHVMNSSPSSAIHHPAPGGTGVVQVKPQCLPPDLVLLLIDLMPGGSGANRPTTPPPDGCPSPGAPAARCRGCRCAP